MKRFNITNRLSGLVTNSYIAQNPMSPPPDWGLPEREKREDLCNAYEISISTGIVTHDDNGVTNQYYILPPEWIETFQDINAEIIAQDIVKYSAMRLAAVVTQGGAALAAATGKLLPPEMHLAIKLMVDGMVAGDISATSDELAWATQQRSIYNTYYGNLKTLLQQAEADIAAYVPIDPDA